MSAEQNKQIVGKIFQEVINRRNPGALESVIATDFVHHGPPGAQGGPDGFMQVVQQFFDAFPDMKVTVEQMIGEGDLIASRGYFTGTHQGNFAGVSATGKQIRADYIDVWKLRDGKAVENWVQMDIVGILGQVGAMNPSAPAEAAA